MFPAEAPGIPEVPAEAPGIPGVPDTLEAPGIPEGPGIPAGAAYSLLAGGIAAEAFPQQHAVTAEIRYDNTWLLLYCIPSDEPDNEDHPRYAQ